MFTEAKVNATTGTGDTALTYACENGHTDVADILLEHGAELVSNFSSFENVKCISGIMLVFLYLHLYRQSVTGSYGITQ